MFLTRRLTTAASILLLVVAPATLAAQDAPRTTSPTATPAGADAPAERGDFGPLLRCTVVVSRFKGDKQISSLPFELFVASLRNAVGAQTSLRVGVDVPNVEFIGTSIDAAAQAISSMEYVIKLTMRDSALTEQGATQPEAGRVRQYSVSTWLRVRDGQSTEFSVGTDPVSGETTRAVVTVRVVK